MGVTCSDQSPGDGWAGAWGDTDGYFSTGDTDYSGAEQNVTQGFAVPEGFDSLWIETSLGVTRLSGAWAHSPGPFSRAIRTDQDVPVPGFLIDGTTPAFLTCFGIIDAYTTNISAVDYRNISVDVVAVNQAVLTDNVVRVAIVLDLALAGDTNSSVKAGPNFASTGAVYSTAHKFGVVAAEPNEDSPELTIVPGLAALDRRGVRTQLFAQNTDLRPDGEFALVSMYDAATDPFAAYDNLVDGAAVAPDSALVAVWGPRTLLQASMGTGDDHAIQGELTLVKPSVTPITFPVNTGKTVGDVRRG